jgi:S-adenosylmethionine:tRNA ribosyltransferase-isomerase
MHTEVISVQRSTIEHLQQKLGNIVAVGTTSVRTLESLYFIGALLAENNSPTALHVTQWAPYEKMHTLSTQR